MSENNLKFSNTPDKVEDVEVIKKVDSSTKKYISDILWMRFFITAFVIILFFVALYSLSPNKKEYPVSGKDYDIKIVALSREIENQNIIIDILKTRIDKLEKSGQKFDSIEDKITDISDQSQRASRILNSVSSVNIDDKKAIEQLSATIQAIKTDISQKSIENDNNIKIVNKTINGVIVNLNDLKRVTDEDRIKIELAINGLKKVKEEVNGIQSQIDELKSMFYDPNRRAVIELRKQGITEIGTVLK